MEKPKFGISIDIIALLQQVLGIAFNFILVVIVEKLLKKKIISFLLLVIFAGCTASPSGDKTHRSTDGGNFSLTSPDQKNKIIIAEEIDGGKDKLNQSDPYNSIIVPLRKALFTNENIFRKEKIGEEFIQRLRLFNQAHLDLAEEVKRNKSAEKIEQLSKSLEQYKILLLHGCSGEKILRCKNINDFKRAANSYDVWKLIYIDAPYVSVDKEFVSMRIGRFLLNDRANDRSIDLRYLKMLPNIESSINSFEPSKKSEALSQHYLMLGRILENPAGIHKSEEFSTFLKYFLSEEIRVTDRSQRLVIKVDLISSDRGNELWNLDWFKDSLRKNYARNEFGYRARVDFIKKNSKSVLKNFNIKEIDLDSKLFYLLDNAYTGVWAVSFVEKMIRMDTSIDKKVFTQEISNYFKTMLIAMTVESNKKFSEFYKNRLNFSSNDIHIKVQEVNGELLGEWHRFHNQVGKLRDLAQLILGQGSPEYESLNINYESINEMVLYMVSYPLTIVMAYQMVINKFLIQGIFNEIDYNKVLEAIFDAKLQTNFFDFSVGDKMPRILNSTGILLTFAYALKTEAFESFGIEVEDFLRITAATLIQNTLADSEKWSERWYQQFALYGNEYELIKKICSQEDYSKEGSYNISVDLTRLGDGILLSSNPIEYLLSTDGSASVSYGSSETNARFNRLTFYSKTHRQSIERFRSNLASRVSYIENLLDIFKDHLDKTIQSNDKKLLIENKIKVAKSPLQRVNHEYRKIYTIAYHTYRDFLSDCVPSFIVNEFKTQNMIIRYEREYLRQLYLDFKKLKEIAKRLQPKEDIYKLQDNEIVSILNKYQLKEYEESKFYGFDQFNLEKNVFEANSLDALLRFKHYLSNGLITDNNVLPAINKNIQVVLPNIENIGEFYDKRANFIIEYNFNLFHTAEEFADYYIKKTMKSNTEYGKKNNFARFHAFATTWLSYIPSDILKYISLLYKAGTVEVYDLKQSSCFKKFNQLEHCKILSESITKNDLSDILFKLHALFNISDDDRDVFQLLDIHMRGIPKVIKIGDKQVMSYGFGSGVLYNPDSYRQLGFFDIYAYIIQSEQQGNYLRLPFHDEAQSSDGSVIMPLMRAKEFARFSYHNQGLIFPLEERTKNSLQQYYKKQVDKEFFGPKNIIQFAKETEENDQRLGIEREIFVKHAEGNSVKNFYISPIVVENIESAELEFYRETFGIYR